MWAHRLSDCKDPSDYAYCTCAVYSCGYSQPHRDRLTFDRLITGTAETDCSYGVGQWLAWGGFLDENPPFSTREELGYLQAHGFEMFGFGTRELARNDVLLMPGHTGIYIGDGMQAEALRDENHGKGDGAEPGDQDQGETVVRPLTHNWKQVLRKHGADVKPAPNDREDQDMTFLFTTDGVHANHVYLYDGLQVRMVSTYEQQEAVRDAYKRCTGDDIPMFHLPDGDHLIALVNSGPVT